MQSPSLLPRMPQGPRLALSLAVSPAPIQAWHWPQPQKSGLPPTEAAVVCAACCSHPPRPQSIAEPDVPLKVPFGDSDPQQKVRDPLPGDSLEGTTPAPPPT